MKHVITATLMLCVLALTGSAFGQTANQLFPGAAGADQIAITQPATPREIVAFVGTEYNPSGSPKATLALGALYPVSPSSFAGVAVDLAFKRSRQPGITIRPEFLPRVLSINGHDVYGIVGLGAQFQASDPTAIITGIKAALSNVGTNVGYNAATGVTTSFRLGKTRNLYLAPVFRIVKGSLNDTAYIGGVVVSTRVQISQ